MEIIFLFLEKLEILETPSINDSPIKIKTLSPITIYKTILNEKGKKFYQYFNPQEEEFYNQIKENIRKKYEIITGKNLKDFEFKMNPIQTKKTLIQYKDFIIEGYDGEFLIEVKPEIFKAVYDAGLGAKNSQGFGMIELIQN